MSLLFQSHWSAVNQIKTEVIKSLSLYYYTFVDIMDFKVSYTYSVSGKMAKEIPCQGKHREFGNFAKTLGKHREFGLLKL